MDEQRSPDDGSDNPRLRPLEAFPVKLEGRTLLCLRDPEGLAEQPIFLPGPATLIVSQMDGTNSLRDIQAEFVRRTGEIVPFEQLAELVAELDRLHMLEGPGLEAFRREREAAFREAPSRPATHAGGAYAGQPAELRRQLDGFFEHPDGPGRDTPPRARRLRGLVAPHIDFHRGGPAYAHAYAALAAQEPFDRYLIFGTCHAGMARRFALTEKSYETPLGSADTDRDFVRRLAGRLSVDYFADELSHRNEHSIEFQGVWLRYILAGRRDFTIVPILVGSFHDLWMRGKDAGDDPELAAMVDAVRATLDDSTGTTCVIAGADLAHVGGRFGDPDGPTRAYLAEVEARDHELLALVSRGDAEGMVRSVAADGDRRRICGYPPMYMTLRALERPEGELLAYRQWSDLEAGAAVTYASLALY